MKKYKEKKGRGELKNHHKRSKEVCFEVEEI
ncbi:hypothetical protein ES332_D04G060100v1 [Gossypium tomentosum]|uniref:Uncharacterized protein n=1 Tax=Gossypium tomentosum TaxID=34277 RepID=A0A5D2LD06_GOSTO|nr:hypothetical protein ES332_D04G060100v1 [Gossypium tomentosum]